MFPITKHFVKKFYSPEKDKTQSVIALAFCGTLLLVQRAVLLRCTKLLILFCLKEWTHNSPTIWQFFLCYCIFLFAIQSIIRELKDSLAYRVRLIKGNNRISKEETIKCWRKTKRDHWETGVTSLMLKSMLRFNARISQLLRCLSACVLFNLYSMGETANLCF